MVAKKLLLVVLFSLQIFAAQSAEQMLQTKIKNLVEPKIYKLHQGLIGVLFKNSASFMQGDSVHLMPVIQTLQDNGLLNLVYKKPISVEVVFQISNVSSLLLVIRSIQNALGELGYSFSITKQVRFDNNSLFWSIDFQTNVGINPGALGTILLNQGIHIVDIQREGHIKWTYNLDAKNAKLDNVREVKKGANVKVSLVGNEILLRPTNITKPQSSIYITSNPKNHWYPHIVFYDKMLNIIKIKKRDRITSRYRVPIPKGTHYIKLLDKYTTDNMKYGFTVLVR